MRTFKKEEDLKKVGERILSPYFGGAPVTITIFEDRDGNIWEKFPDSYGDLLFGGGFIENQYDDTGFLEGVAKYGYARLYSPKQDYKLLAVFNRV